MEKEMRLIDANAYPCQNCEVSYCYKNCEKFNAWLKGTVVAAPVVRGRWEHNEYGLQCSKCACDSLYNGFNHPVRSAFCPNCGAVMEDEYNEAID